MFDWFRKKERSKTETGPGSAEKISGPPLPATPPLAPPTKAQCDAWLGEGRLDDALAGYRAALAQAPGDVDLYINIGYILLEQQQAAEAVPMLQQAARFRPENVDAWYLLGSALRAHGDAPAAIEAWRRLLAVKPDFTLVYGDLSRLLCMTGLVDEGKALIRQALQHDPDDVALYQYLGNLLASEGAHADAVQAFHEALKRQSDLPGVANNLGLSLLALGDTDAAIASFDKALTGKPGDADFLCNLAVGYLQKKDIDAAIGAYRQAIGHKPDSVFACLSLANLFEEQKDNVQAIDCLTKGLHASPNAVSLHVNLGVLLQKEGRLDGAVEHARAAIAIDASLAAAYLNLGSALHAQGDIEQAMRSFRQAIALNPGFAKAHLSLGVVLQDTDRLDEAAEAYRLAIVAQPDYAEAFVNLGNVLQGQGRLADAAEKYREAMRIKPDFRQAQNNLLYLQTFDPACTADAYLTEARSFGERVTRAALATGPAIQPTQRAVPGAPLRVGLVSGDLRRHPVGYFLESIVGKIDPASISLHAYVTYSDDDAVTQRLKACCSQWCSIAGMDDAAAAARIRSDRIDVLIDLAGHTAQNRLPVFAYRPAPVQVAWLGYWASTGMSQIDYVITDSVSTPSDFQVQFTEKLWPLPDTRLCFTPPPDAPAVTPLPLLINGHLTFGSFQNTSKISDATLALWSLVLARLPGARLRLQSKQMGQAAARSRMLDRLRTAGIDVERVRLVGPVVRQEYLAAHAEVDVLLDTLGFPGGTTTCEAVWMGVPTLTLAGSTMVARQGASLVSSAGLGDWVAFDEEEYVDKAVALTADAAWLAGLRAGLREQARASPLFDSVQFASHLDKALHDMYRTRATAVSH